MDKAESKSVISVPNFAPRFPVSLLDLTMATGVSAISLIGIEYLTKENNFIPYIRTGLFCTEILAACSWFISGFVDYLSLRGKREIDFTKRFGIGPYSQDYPSMGYKKRKQELSKLIEILNDSYVPYDLQRKEASELVNAELTDYIERFTGQRIETSSKIRGRGLCCGFINSSGTKGNMDIARDIFVRKGFGISEPWTIAHELAHRKGYGKELDAQLLTYFALSESGNQQLMQSAYFQRLYSNADALSNISDKKVNLRKLRRELALDFLEFIEGRKGIFMKFKDYISGLCHKKNIKPRVNKGYREQIPGQKRKGGFEDYHKNFTDYLHVVSPLN